MSPRLRVAYLVGVAVGVFILKEPWQLGATLLAQILIWVRLRYPPTAIVRMGRRLFGLLFFIMLSFLLFPPEGEAELFRVLGLDISLRGLEAGAVMALRIFTVILTSQLIRQDTDESTFVQGLRGLVPASLAITIDATLHLLAESGGRGGSGGGRHRRVRRVHA